MVYTSDPGRLDNITTLHLAEALYTIVLLSVCRDIYVLNTPYKARTGHLCVQETAHCMLWLADCYAHLAVPDEIRPPRPLERAHLCREVEPSAGDERYWRLDLIGLALR